MENFLELCVPLWTHAAPKLQKNIDISNKIPIILLTFNHFHSPIFKIYLCIYIKNAQRKNARRYHILQNANQSKLCNHCRFSKIFVFWSYQLIYIALLSLANFANFAWLLMFRYFRGLNLFAVKKIVAE